MRCYQTHPALRLGQPGAEGARRCLGSPRAAGQAEAGRAGQTGLQWARAGGHLLVIPQTAKAELAPGEGGPSARGLDQRSSPCSPGASPPPPGRALARCSKWGDGSATGPGKGPMGEPVLSVEKGLLFAVGLERCWPWACGQSRLEGQVGTWPWGDPQTHWWVGESSSGASV